MILWKRIIVCDIKQSSIQISSFVCGYPFVPGTFRLFKRPSPTLLNSLGTSVKSQLSITVRACVSVPLLGGCVHREVWTAGVLQDIFTLGSPSQPARALPLPRLLRSPMNLSISARYRQTLDSVRKPPALTVKASLSYLV